MTQTVVQISPTTLPLSAAHALTDTAIAESAEIGVPCTVAVLDGGGNLVLLTRMDGAALASIDAAVAKARTAVQFGTATADLVDAVQPGAPFYTIAAAATQPLTFVAGGVPVHDAAGVVIGGIGVAGGSPRQDHEIAVAALADC